MNKTKTFSLTVGKPTDWGSVLNKIPNSIRNKISSLSTGNLNKNHPSERAPYYKQYSDFYEELDKVLRDNGLMTYVEMPTPHNEDGHLKIGLADSENCQHTGNYLMIYYHRMDQTGNWEIIVYLS